MSHCKFQSQTTGLILLVAFFAFISLSNVVAQQDKLIEAIDFQGNRRLSDEDILKLIKTRPGDRFDEKLLQEDLQSLLKLGVFSPSQIRVLAEEGMRGGVNVIFEVFELPLITKVNFDGLRYATKEEILAELREQKAEVTTESPYQPEKLSKARRIILEYLGKKRGFVDARADVTTEEVSATTLIVSFVIDELPNDDEDCCEDDAASYK
ncbi:MAG: POTRA domain-containing protein [Pyrinomonadaceae bacterium]